MLSNGPTWYERLPKVCQGSRYGRIFGYVTRRGRLRWNDFLTIPESGSLRFTYRMDGSRYNFRDLDSLLADLAQRLLDTRTCICPEPPTVWFLTPDLRAPWKFLCTVGMQSEENSGKLIQCTADMLRRR